LRGIAGTCGFADEELLREMCAAINHRGPDDTGYYIDKGVALGNKRLSIIDLSSSGHQPISNENKSIWATFNGEIYNFRSLRYELEKVGHKFTSMTDTEVLVHLYEEEGEDCVRSLRGMFGFALWDSLREKLVLARDRLGIKPLYYSILENGIIFASEIKAILQYDKIKRELNPNALDAYLSLRYVPGPETMFKNI
jgi:asparagine synthase (glutamine-hydrolysing)